MTLQDYGSRAPRPARCWRSASAPPWRDDVPLYHDKGFWSKQFQAVGDAAQGEDRRPHRADLLRAAGAIQGVHPVLDRVGLAARLVHLVDRRDLQGPRRHRPDRAARRCLGRDDRLAADSEKATQDLFKVDGKTYAVPLSVSRWVVLYNKKIFADLGSSSPRPGTS